MIQQTYNLELIPGGVPVRVPVSQYDTDSRGIVFSLYAGGMTFSVPDGAIVTCDGAKPDRKGFSYLCTYSGSTVTAAVTEQMTAVAGEVECQITIRKDGAVLGSANFLLVVELAALPNGVDTSETEIDTLVQIANQAADAAQEAREAVDTLDGKKAALDASTAAAEDANTELTAATETAGAARTDLVSATNAGNTARENLEAATAAANSAGDSLQETTQDALAAKGALDGSITAGQGLKQELDETNTAASGFLEELNDALESHTHQASDITSGTFSTDRLPTVPITKGGTGATTAAAARTNLGAAAASHTHAAADINSGTLSSDRLPTVLVSKGGTGATTAAAARGNLGTLGAVSSNGYYGMVRPDGNVSDWIRTSENGIIPYQSGGASALGTSSWPFNQAYINTVFGKTQYVRDSYNANNISISYGQSALTSSSYIAAWNGYTLGCVTLATLRSLLGISDYVTSQGTSGNWRYRQWASGWKECWMHTTVSIGATSKWDYTVMTSASYSFALPLTFTAIKTVAGSAGQYQHIINPGITSSKVTFQLACGHSMTGNSADILLYVAGT